MRFLTTAIGLLLLGCPVRSDVTLFEGPAGGVGDVRVYDELGVAPPSAPTGLQGIQLLPIECSGRSMLSSLQANLPQLRSDIPGAARIVLPFSRGSLYKYRRDGVGSSTYGYFVVQADGAARSLFEMPGTGALFADDPIPGQLGMDPAGDSILVGTTSAAGGNLIEIDLGTGLFVDRTASAAPLHFLPGGMRLLSTWGVALTQKGALRFDRIVGGGASLVMLPVWGEPRLAFSEVSAGPLAYVGDGVVASADESTVAFVAGFSPNQAHVFVFGETGPAVRATSEARALQGAGFLPECAIGPTLALATDGSCVSFRSAGSTAEAWARSTGQLAPPAFQITADPCFVDTLGETGVIGFLSPRLLILLVGEFGVESIEKADVYRVDLVSRDITNISFTSGQGQVPFTPGSLNTEEGFWQLPDSSGALGVPSTSGGERELLMVPWNLGPAVEILDQLKSLDTVTVAGGDLVLDARRSTLIKTRDLLRWSPAQPATTTLLASFGDDCAFTSQVGQTDGTYAAILDCPAGQWLGSLNVSLEIGMQLTLQPLAYGPVLGVAPSGAIVATVMFLGRTYLFTWSSANVLNVVTVLSTAGHVLPGI